MSKRIISLFLAVFMIACSLSIVSCGDEGGGNQPPIGPGNNAGGDNVLTAPDGSSVTLPASVTKIVTVSAAAKDIIDVLGASSKVVASYDADKDATSDIINAKPEIVIYDDGAAIDVKKITDAGIVAVKLPKADSVAKIKNHLTFIGQVVGTSAESQINSITKSLETMQLATKAWTTKLNVYIELGSGEDGFYTVAPYSYVHELLSSAGGNNIFSDSDKEGFVTVTADEILAKNPDVIFVVGSADDIKGREGWSECKAIANGNVFELPAPVASDSVVDFAQAINDKLNVVMNPGK